MNAFIENEPVVSKTKSKGKYLKTHALLPRIQYHDYLDHPFEDRLGYELACIGLDPPKERSMNDDQPFATEIKSMRHVLETDIIPPLKEMKQMLLEKLPEFIEDQQRREENLAAYQEILQEVKAHQKQKK